MATYINDLRLKEISTGDESGTWGTSTNTNLELIGEALGYATQQVFGSDADATTTVADGASDPARAMYFKITSAGSLTATRTCTIAPNTVSRVMFIENATSGSQSIAISQGSGANVTIATGKTAVVYLDGAGAGAAVVDAMAGVDPGVTDTLAEVLVAGNTTGGTDIELSTTDKVQFRDSAIYINSSADGQLDIVADTEIQIAATTIDINGAINASGEIIAASLDISGDIDVDGTANLDVVDIDGAVDMASTLAVGGVVTANAGIDIDNINIDGTTIALSSGDLTLDVAGRILLDANTDGNVRFLNSGTLYGQIFQSTDMYIRSVVADTNLIFQGNDNGSNITALTLNMSAAGAATFNSSITIPDWVYHSGDSNTYFGFPSGDEFKVVTANIGRLHIKGSESVWNEGGENVDFRVESDSNANMLHVDSGNNGVGIGTTGTTTPLTVNGGTATAATIQLGNHGDNAAIHAKYNLAFKADSTEAIADRSIAFSIGTHSAFYSNVAGTVFNEGGANSDFRVESDGNSHMLFVDAGTNRVGIGESVPEAALHINSKGNGSGIGFYIDTNTRTFGETYFYLGRDAAPNLTIDTSENITFNGSTVFNEASADVDFRVESNGNANMLFVDGGANRVGVGISPTETLHANGRSRIQNLYLGEISSNLDIVQATSSAGLYLVGGGSNVTIGTAGFIFNEGGADKNFRVESSGNDNMIFVDAGNDQVIIGASSGLNPSDAGLYAREGLIVGNFSGSGNGFTVYRGSGLNTNINHDSTKAYLTTSGIPLHFRTSLDTNFKISMETDGVVINENGSDYDFRVESDVASGSFFVDGASGYVGINDTSPSAQLNLNTSDGLMTILNSSHASGGYVRFEKSGTVYGDLGNGAQIVSGGATTAFGMNTRGTGDLLLATNGVTRASIQNGGAFTTNPLAGGHAVFNESGVDADFRVESDTNANMLFVDASTNRIGIGSSAPTDPLTISSSFLSANNPGTQFSIYAIDNDSVFKIGQDGNNSTLLTMSDSGATQTVRIAGHGGSITITGALSKGSGSFKIDHPLPAKTGTHHLVHSFLEAPQADNVYRGKVDLVAGSASVNIDTVAGMTDGTFVLLNREVQCFTSNESGWTAVRGSVSGNTLTITAQDNTCVDTISWLVIGERQDQHMYDTEWTDSNGKVIVEPLKGE